MISVVLMNWKRPENVQRILTHLYGLDLVGEVIVWNNNPDCARESFMVEHQKGVLIESSRDMSLFTRFSAATLARHECVLYHDDDVLLPQKTITGLYTKWQDEPDRIYGPLGRRRKSGNRYSSPTRSGAAPIILTTAMISKREYASMALRFRDHPDIAPLLREGVPYGNGEDLVISYVAMRESGKQNMTCNLSVKKLSRPHPICLRWPQHFNYRTRLMRALDEHVVRLG